MPSTGARPPSPLAASIRSQSFSHAAHGIAPPASRSSKDTRGPRTRPRATSPSGALVSPEPAHGGAQTRRRGARRGPADRGVDRDPGGVGPRPEAPWHPWPFSELLILVGAIGTIVGFAGGQPATLFAGLG